MPISAYDKIDYAAYKPISFQEMWAPAQQLRQQHDQLQEEYAQQEQQGGLSLLGIDPVKDKAAYDIQQNFITKTKEAADQLATKGFIDSGRRRGLMEVKSLYTNQVVPLQNQLKIRQERAEELRRMQLQDPTFRATANPNDIDLMTGLKNPNAFNYDGVSGNQLYKSVAEKANQLSKIVEQEHPELIKSGLAYQYFTAVKSGANLSQIDKAMRQQFNPADVDKMTNLMHGVVSSTMNEFGVPQKFGNNQKVQDELWQVASQGLYAAAGQTNFGSMHDSWNEGNARRAQALADKNVGQGKPPILPKFPMNYAPDISDKEAYTSIDNLGDAAKGRVSKSSITGFGPYGSTRTYNPDASLNNINNAKQKIIDLAKKNNIEFKTSSTGSMTKKDYELLVDKVVNSEKEKLKSVSPVYTIATGDDNVSKSVYQALQSGAVTLPKSGSKELTTKKFNELRKLHGAPIITYAPMGSGIEIRFGDGDAYKADGSIFQNPIMSDRLKYLSESGKSIRGAIMDPEKNKSSFKRDNSGNYVINANEYGVDLSQYNIPNYISFSEKQLKSPEVKEYLKLISQIQNASALSEMFPAFATQNSGMDINAWTENKKTSNSINLYNNQDQNQE